MSYATIEAKVQDLIQGLSAFDDDDVSLGDYRVLVRGSPTYAVLVPGPFEHEEYDSWGGRITRWDITIDLFVRDYADGTEYVDLKTHRQSILDEIDKYPTLDGLTGVTLALIVVGEPTRDVFDEAGGGPHFLLQRMTLRVTEHTLATGGEFA